MTSNKCRWNKSRKWFRGGRLEYEWSVLHFSYVRFSCTQMSDDKQTQVKNVMVCVFSQTWKSLSVKCDFQAAWGKASTLSVLVLPHHFLQQTGKPDLTFIGRWTTINHLAVAIIELKARPVWANSASFYVSNRAACTVWWKIYETVSFYPAGAEWWQRGNWRRFDLFWPCKVLEGSCPRIRKLGVLFAAFIWTLQGVTENMRGSQLWYY